MEGKIQKLFRFEVDQSIRVEELTKDTIIGIANNEEAFTLRIKSKTKRHVYEYFRRWGKPKKFGPATLAAGIIVAVGKSTSRVSELIIDIEYPGYEITIQKIIQQAFPNIMIYFGLIGKKSPAHHAAYGVHVEKKISTWVAERQELMRLIKNDPRTVTPPDQAGRFAVQ